MAYPQAKTHTKGSGAIIRLGSFAAESMFDSSPAIVSETTSVPLNVQNQIPVMDLHASGGSNYTSNRQYLAPVSGRMAYEEHTQFSFRTGPSTTGSFNGNKPVTLIRPNSNNGTVPGRGTIRQGWVGYLFRESPNYQLFTFRRLDALYHWMKTDLANPANPANIDLSYLCLTGGSMGAWGTMYYGLRRPGQFAALYADRPRVRWDDKVGGVDYSVWDTGGVNGSLTNQPNVDPADGGGTVYDIHNAIGYVSNPDNFVPWLGWNIGENDTYTPLSDHIDMVAAMRAAGRPFAFAWNRLNHSGGMIMSKILASYPFGTFQIGKSYPHFTNHSRDIEPTIDDGLGANSTQAMEGGINLDLAFRNVIETSTGWVCEVTSIADGETFVDVRPYNCSVFTANVAPKTVRIPAAKTWVAVSFSA